MQPCVYILFLSNGQYYIGSTNDLERRMCQHNNGECNSTKNKRPVKLAFCQNFDRLAEARRVEYRLKRLKSRKVIEVIIKDNKINLELLC